MARCKIILCVVVVLLLGGCAPSITNITSLRHESDLEKRIFKSPSLDHIQLRTFTVLPSKFFKEGPPEILGQTVLENEIVEMQILFFLRNIFESKGYKFVEASDHPDFVATIDGFMPYKEFDIPPQLRTIPKWIPGKTLTTSGGVSGTYRSSGLGSRGTFGGSMTTTTYIPGYMTTETYTISGYTYSNYYPCARIDVFDSSSGKIIWTGYGVGASKNSDFRVASQVMIGAFLQDFPKGPFLYLKQSVRDRFGFEFGVLTNDGNNYYPCVTVIPNSPAKKAGIKQYDFILSIDGIPTKNKTVSEILDILERGSQKKKSLTLLRVNEMINVEIFGLNP